MRWELQEENKRAAMEKHVTTGKVGLCLACHNTFPFFFPVMLANTPIQLCSAFPFTLLNSLDSASSVQSQSRLMSALYWLCGIERREEGENNLVMPPAPEQAICSLKEKPHLRIIVNINLIICLSVTAFIIGYWAWRTGYDTLYGHMVVGLCKRGWID